MQFNNGQKRWDVRFEFFGDLVVVSLFPVLMRTKWSQQQKHKNKCKCWNCSTESNGEGREEWVCFHPQILWYTNIWLLCPTAPTASLVAWLFLSKGVLKLLMLTGFLSISIFFLCLHSWTDVDWLVCCCLSVFVRFAHGGDKSHPSLTLDSMVEYVCILVGDTAKKIVLWRVCSFECSGRAEVMNFPDADGAWYCNGSGKAVSRLATRHIVWSLKMDKSFETDLW